MCCRKFSGVSTVSSPFLLNHSGSSTLGMHPKVSPRQNQLHGLYDAIALHDADGKTISAGELWKSQPVLIVCLRRLGCSERSLQADVPLLILLKIQPGVVLL